MRRHPRPTGSIMRGGEAWDLLVRGEGQVTVRLHFDPKGGQRRCLGVSGRLLRGHWGRSVTSEEIGQSGILRKPEGDLYRLVTEGFHDEGAIVVGKQTYFRRCVHADGKVPQDVTANRVQRGLRDFIQIGEIVGDRKDKEFAFAVLVHEQNREGVVARDAANNGPGIIGEKTNLWEK